MLRQLARILLEPIAQALRRFFDPRFTRLEQSLKHELGRATLMIDSLTQVVRKESETASVRDQAMRDGLTLTNTRMMRVESEIAAIRQTLENLSHQEDGDDKAGRIDEEPPIDPQPDA